MATVAINEHHIQRLLKSQSSNGDVFNEQDTYITDEGSFRYDAASNTLVPRYTGANRSLGWADYSDSTYTSGSPFLFTANTDTILPNDGVNGIKSHAPPGIDLYDAATQKITGRQGDTLLITVEFKVEKQGPNGQFDLENWWDIGGSVGELYRRYHRIRDVVGPRTVLHTTQVYTLDTWEANGATTYIRTNVEALIYDIRYVIGRNYAGRS